MTTIQKPELTPEEKQSRLNAQFFDYFTLRRQSLIAATKNTLFQEKAVPSPLTSFVKKSPDDAAAEIDRAIADNSWEELRQATEKTNQISTEAKTPGTYLYRLFHNQNQPEKQQAGGIRGRQRGEAAPS